MDIERRAEIQRVIEKIQQEAHLEGTSSLAALSHAVAYAAILDREGTSSPADFSKKLERGVREMARLSDWLGKRLSTAGITAHPPDLVNQYFELTARYGQSLAMKTSSFTFHARRAIRWLKMPPTRAGSFGIHNELGLHEESPLNWVVRTPEGLAIATIGGLLKNSQAGHELVVTNIEGKAVGEAPRTVDGHPIVYEELNEAFGENWRVALLRRAAALAKKKGWRLRVEMPMRFGGETRASAGEYRRQVRQYQQTCRKAGLRRHPKGFYTF